MSTSLSELLLSSGGVAAITFVVKVTLVATGGLVAARLTAIAGASGVVRGGIVSYASDVKHDLLDVAPGPVVNEPAAVQMAEGAQRVLGADVGLGLTGVAGPTEQDDVPVGTVCIAVALPTGSHASTVKFGTQREQVRQFAVISALDLLRRRLAMAVATSS